MKEKKVTDIPFDRFRYHKQCTANSRRTGEPCQNWAVKDHDTCRMHGGKTPRGIASPLYKHGRFSKHLPTRLAVAYNEAINDPDLLSLRSDIALTDARLSEVIKLLDTGESGALWVRLRGTWDSLMEAKAAGDAAKMATRMVTLGEAIERGASERESFMEIGMLLEQRRRLVATEEKRLVDMQQIITTEQAMMLVGSLVDSLRRHISDRSVLAAIAAEFSGILENQDRRAAPEG